ncbi:hypothetical protein ASE70_14860 [Sphingomonas sp. Leaf22]|uniref:hypothetical protein n=1 Tax=Sphingomonas sp. Leaf22 TaxID=1735687 RepID=UPI0006FE054B|nr:hypothetical protein [Sphingomonas sp. Leaf22]KQM92193.1 hypothetical protein ASE70_14860 [Sphingomonas sp. Leaf22]
MRPRGPDGTVCTWCLGHQPTDCFCQGQADYPGLSGLNAYSTRSHGWSLIALCALAIEDGDVDNAVAEGAFTTRDRLAAKHGMPNAAWIEREKQWLRPRYERTKEVRARFRHLDEAWASDPDRTEPLPPSYKAAVFAAMGASMGIGIDMTYPARRENTNGKRV